MNDDGEQAEVSLPVDLKLVREFELMMARLGHLEREVPRLRFALAKPPESIQKILSDAGWEVKQSGEGLWGYTIPMNKLPTGGYGYRTFEEALKAALERTSEMVFAEDEEDDDE